MKALALKAEQRWSSAAEMERAIINLPPITVRPPTTTLPSQGPSPQPSSGGTPPTPSGPQLGVNGPAGSLIRAAQDHVNAGRFDVAHGVVQQAYNVEPHNALVHKLFGQIFLRRQPPAPDLAMQAFTRSSQLNPNDAETHKLLGDVWLYFRRQPATAITAYTQSLRLNPGDFEAHQRLAKCYEETGQFEPALREYQEAVRLAPAPRKPEMQYGYNSLGLLAWRAGNLTIAERAFVHALILNPADHQARFFLSRVYEREGKLDEAYRECSYVVGAMPKNAEAQTMFQRLRTQLGR
jgi:tetratricopeptide (TPR) repeat protein